MKRIVLASAMLFAFAGATAAQTPKTVIGEVRATPDQVTEIERVMSAKPDNDPAKTYFVQFRARCNGNVHWILQTTRDANGREDTQPQQRCVGTQEWSWSRKR